MKRLVVVILIVGCTYAQGQRCNHCQPDQHYHLFSCVNDCPGSSGACSCVIGDRDQSCYECGCCYWVDGQTGYAICSDPSGAECGNFPCQQGTISANATSKDTRLSGAALIEAAPWLESATLPQQLSRYSPTFEELIESYQRTFRQDNTVPYVDRRVVRGHHFLKDGFVIDFTVLKLNGIWRFEIAKIDPSEDQATAATALEIRGHDWTLYHHVHEIDKEIKTVAQGTF